MTIIPNDSKLFWGTLSGVCCNYMVNVHVHVRCPFFDPNMPFISIQSFTYVSAAIAMRRALAGHGEEENDSDEESQPPRKKIQGSM